jgi:CDP-diacylglycerol--glycerol-3-phosphate 3-phosphatidyltransferase/cardiolipin synthase
VGGNNIRLLVDERRALPQLLDCIHGAQHVVDVDMFSWMDSGSGTQVAQALMERARAGVEVNVEVDDVGSFQYPYSSSRDLMNDMAEAGVHLIRNPYEPGGNHPMDHRKLYVIDGNTAFIGGMNLARKYDVWHDVMVKVQGPVVAQASTAFVNAWRAHGGAVSDQQQRLLDAPPAATAAAAAAGTGGGSGAHVGVDAGADHDTGGASAHIVSNMPGVDMQATADFLDHVAGAKRRVWVESPWIGDERFATALEDAARRGVDVRLLVTGLKATNAAPAVGYASRSFYPDLTAAGVKVFEQQNMSHGKVLLADDYVTVGSMNMSHCSEVSEAELNIGVDHDPYTTAAVERLFEHDRHTSVPVDPASLHTKLDKALWPLRHVLHVQY